MNLGAPVSGGASYYVFADENNVARFADSSNSVVGTVTAYDSSGKEIPGESFYGEITRPSKVGNTDVYLQMYVFPDGVNHSNVNNATPAKTILLDIKSQPLLLSALSAGTEIKTSSDPVGKALNAILDNPINVYVDPVEPGVVNQAPSGADNTLVTDAGAAYTFSAEDFGFTDPDGDALLAVEISTLPTGGVLTLNGNPVTAGQSIPASEIGKLVFTPDAGTSGDGASSFTFKVQDDGGATGGGVDKDPTPNKITFDVAAPQPGELSINNVEVNEASPFAVFTVTGSEGDKIKLALSQEGTGEGYATQGTDYSPSLEYFDGTAWKAYAPGSEVTLTGTTLLVRTAITNDTTPEGVESFKLTATNSAGSAEGVGAIRDDGKGEIFTPDNTTGEPNEAGDPGYPAALDNDAPGELSINNVEVNEASPFAVFTVAGSEGDKIKLALSQEGIGEGYATQGTDYSSSLEYFDGTAWKAYEPGSEVTLTGTTLLVRTAITNDTAPEGVETFKLTATNSAGSAEGVGSIRDDGKGEIFTPDNTTGEPNKAGDPGYPEALDNDTPGALSVNNVEVNEASPFAVFTVTGLDGDKVKLALSEDGTGAGHATQGTDYSASLEYFDGTEWQAYEPDSEITLTGTTLLVRTAITNDTAPEGVETFKLTATNSIGSAEGVGAIRDDGQGAIFTPDNTTGVPNEAGDPGYPAVLDNDTPGALSVNNVEVNEASPFAVFTVNGSDGEKVKLALSQDGTGAGHATQGTDYSASLEYFDGTAWKAYAPGSEVTLNGTTLLVRTAITNDPTPEGRETFQLTATNSVGSAEGVGAIRDDGKGAIFTPDNTTGVPNKAGDPGYPAVLDNDAPGELSINNVEVNEASPFAVFTVTGLDGDKIKLALSQDGIGAGHATQGTDYSASLEYFDGTAWKAYAAGSEVTLNGTTLLVRTAITNDTAPEGRETFQLTATNSVGSAEGVGAIRDDGKGAIFTPDNTTGAPNKAGDPGYPAVLDNDALGALSIDNVEVNEASPFAVFTVTGRDGEKIKLALSEDGIGSGHATQGVDYSASLEYFDGTVWKAYAPDSEVTLNGTTLLVRTAITNDPTPEGRETFKLTATNSVGSAEGVGAIRDDGKGLIFTPDNITGEPNKAGDPGYPAVLDNDQGQLVYGAPYNESSPDAIFLIDATPGQQLTLDVRDVAPDSARPTTGLDDAPLVYSLDGGASWLSYRAPITAGVKDVMVAVDIAAERDGVYEGPEYLQLVVNDGAPTQSSAFALILDNGEGWVINPVEAQTVNYVIEPIAPAPLDNDYKAAVEPVGFVDHAGHGSFC